MPENFDNTNASFISHARPAFSRMEECSRYGALIRLTEAVIGYEYASLSPRCPVKGVIVVLGRCVCVDFYHDHTAPAVMACP